MEVVDAWRSWSQEMGLKENIGKTQFVSTTARGRAHLEEIVGEECKDQVKKVLHVLGTHSVAQGVEKLCQKSSRDWTKRLQQ